MISSRLALAAWESPSRKIAPGQRRAAIAAPAAVEQPFRISYGQVREQILIRRVAVVVEVQMKSTSFAEDVAVGKALNRQVMMECCRDLEIREQAFL